MNVIIIPVVIVVAIGLIASIILVIASKLMFVPVDETVAKVREVLPGANCGACGFAGCDDYAKALGSGDGTSASMCPVGGAAVAAQIAAILGVEVEEMEPQMAYVMCNGTSSHTKQIMVPDRLTSCKTAKMFYGGNWACTYGCLGLGDCQDACQYGAITVKDGVAKVNPDACVACGACVKACPNNVIAMMSKKMKVHVLCRSVDKAPAVRKICDIGCIGCKKCEKTCKFDAIHVTDFLASIDYDKCKNCGMCVKECPTGAIINLRKPKAKAAVKKPEETPVAS